MRGNSLRSGRLPANSMEQDSFDSDDAEDMLVMSANGLNLNIPRSSESPTTSAGGDNASSRRNDSLNVSGEEDELPKSVIVTNVDISVFDNDETKAKFESLFSEFEQNPTFHYLRSFRRIRVDFESHLSASNAKINLDNTPLADSIINCYFIQVLSPCSDKDVYLHVPPLEKQFLISPPCSPPVGWEQPIEDKPVVDYDLLAAMAQLTPGENHELHPSKEVQMLGKSVSTPSIVVHICDEGTEDGGNGGRRIKPTSRPDRQSSLD